MRITALLLLLAPWAANAQTLSAAGFDYIAKRSPTVLDTFFHFQTVCETRQPRGYFEANLVIGPTLDTPTTTGVEPLRVAGGRITFCTVPWAWSEHAGIRLNIDGYSTNLTPEDDPNVDGWGYRQALTSLSVFNREVGWNAAAGIWVAARPVTEVVGDQRVFSRNAAGETTAKSAVAGFVQGTLPWGGLSGALLIDDHGIRQARITSSVYQHSSFDAVGPFAGAFPQLRNYQLGAHLMRYRPFDYPFDLSAEVAGRWESGDGFAFNHALLKAEVCLFRDIPDRNTNFRSPDFDTDFQVRLTVFGSFYNLPESRGDWGGGGRVELVSIGLGPIEGRVGLGFAYNYYEDLMMLQVPDEGTVSMTVAVGL